MSLRFATVHENAPANSPPAAAGGGQGVVGRRADSGTHHPQPLLGRGGELFSWQRREAHTHSGRDARASAPESAPGWRGESPLQVNVTCNRLQLRRGDTGWGAAGGERPVRTIRNSIRPVWRGEPASEWRSPEFPWGYTLWGSDLGAIRRGVTCPDETQRAQVVGDGMAGRPGA